METKPNRLKPEEQKLVEEHLPLVKRVADRRSLNRYTLYKRQVLLNKFLFLRLQPVRFCFHFGSLPFF